MRHPIRLAVLAQSALLVTPFLAGCFDDSFFSGDERIELKPHPFLPGAEYAREETQVAAGAISGEALQQPIAFPHYTHATVAGIDCQYCHADARKGIHAGVPSTSVCMGCHTYIKKDSPEIQKLAAYWDEGHGDPIPWKKVHDVPDFVHFDHHRHVRAGVNCTECHGQVMLQGRPETVTVQVHDEAGHAHEEQKTAVATVMIRETTLQMGWCLDCHYDHPSLEQNYKDEASGIDLVETRRAELRDCWTCHK